MVLTIGNLYFEKLSGPISLSILQPTNDLTKIISHFTPILLLVGDIHHTRKTICKDENSVTTLSTFTPFWLRILDSLATTELPVLYFVEGSFPVDLLDSPYYLRDDKKKWLMKLKDKTVMTYALKYHPECFSSNKKIKQQGCVTSNINYYFADLRLGISFANINKKDRETIQTRSVELAQKITPRILLTSQKHDNPSDHSRHQRSLIYSESEDTFESVVYSSIESALSENRSFTERKVTHILDTDIRIILELIFKNPKKCSQLIFDASNEEVQTSSLLYKAMIGVSVDKKTIKKLVKLFQDYFVYICENDQELLMNKFLIFKALKNYDKDTKILKRMFYQNIKIEVDEDELTDDEIVERRKINKEIESYNQACETIATTIFMAFNEMYYLFSSWSKQQYSSMSIYHCGDQHSKYLSDFLISKGLYTSVEEVRNKKDNQCLTFKRRDFDIDSIISKNILSSPKIAYDTKQNYLIKQYINKQRIAVLGDMNYFNMLSGEILSNDEFEQICDDHNLTNKKCLELLDMTSISITVPSDFTQKIKSI
jgi:hypothetical protein